MSETVMKKSPIIKVPKEGLRFFSGMSHEERNKLVEDLKFYGNTKPLMVELNLGAMTVPDILMEIKINQFNEFIQSREIWYGQINPNYNDDSGLVALVAVTTGDYGFTINKLWIENTSRYAMNYKIIAEIVPNDAIINLIDSDYALSFMLRFIGSSCTGPIKIITVDLIAYKGD